MSKSVLITGGALRLGKQLVHAFAADGWNVWCHYQRSESHAKALQAEMSACGWRIHLVQADLGEPSDIVDMIDHIAQHSGPLHTVVNNASLFEPDEGTRVMLESARRQMDVNLMAPMYLGQLLASQQTAREGSDACVIHILDQKVFNLNPDYFSYTLSKLALERAVGLQAQALAPAVRVCGVAPGLMYLSGPQEPENFELASKINLRRTATNPVDVARTCVFIASTPSITGTTICVDNGQHLVPLQRDVMFLVDEWIKKQS